MDPAPEPGGAARPGAWSLAAWSLALALGLAAAFWIPLQAPVPGAFSDSVDYLVFSDTLGAMLRGQHSPESDWFFLQTRYPPLFPLALSAVGAGIADPGPAAWLTSALLAAAWLLATVWFAREAGAPAGYLLAVPVILNSGWWLAVMNPLSEPLFLCAVLAGLLWARRVRHGQGFLVFALLVGLAPLCRSAGFALVLAAAAWLAWVRPGAPRRLLATVLLMAAPGLLWSLLRAQYPVFVSYSGDLAQSLGSPEGWRRILAEQPARMIESGIGLLDPWSTGWRSPLLALVPLFLGGLALRLRERQLDALFVLVYAGLVAVWPYPAETSRLLLILVPMVVLYSWQALAWLVRWRFPAARPGAIAAAFVAAVLGVVAPFLLGAAARVAEAVDPSLEPAKRDRHYFLPRSDAVAGRHLEIRTRIDRAMDATGDAVPAGDCVYTFYPQSLFAHAPSTTAVPMPYPRDGAIGLREQFARCRYYFVTVSPSAQFGEPALYPLPEAGSLSRPVFASFMEGSKGPVLIAALYRFED